MDSSSNHDYRQQGLFHGSHPGYSLHAAEGHGHEDETRAGDERRPVHGYPYLDERPDRSSGSVDLGYPNDGEYCEFSSALGVELGRSGR